MSFVFDGWTAAFGIYILGCFLGASHIKTYSYMKEKYTKEVTVYSIPKLILVCALWPVIVVLFILAVTVGIRMPVSK